MALICKRKFYSKLKNLKGLWFHIVGIACLIWFVIRVFPAPHRSQYPCQQISLSIALGYITFWSILFYGVRTWFKKVKTKTFAIIPSIAVVFLLFFSMSSMVLGVNYQNPNLNNWTPISKDPMGDPIGINPGRVVWTWNPDATERELSGYWWMEENNNQTVINDMFSKGIKSLTDESSDEAAWDTLFKFFNFK